MDLVKRLEEYRDRERELMWEGTFAQYFEIASKKPGVSRLSHERIYHMIMDAGTESLALKSHFSRSLTTSTPQHSAWKCVNVSCS